MSMDITTSKPTQAEAAALVNEFVAKSYNEWPAGEDLHFLAKQLEAALFSTFGVNLSDFEEAADQYKSLQELDDMSNEDVAETLDATRYNDGQRDMLRRDIEDNLNTAINDILTSAGFKRNQVAA